MSGYSVEVRVDVGGDDLVPHTFVVVTDSNGVEKGFGFGPAEQGVMNGPGKIYDDFRHEYSMTSGKLEITQQQYESLMDYVERSTQNPPPYALWFGSQCATWVVDGLVEAGIVPSIIGTDIQPNNLITDFVETLLVNPYFQWVGFHIYWIDRNTNTGFNAAQNWTPPRIDPLALDLDGDGIETVGIGDWNNTVLFDHDGDGQKAGTGWLSGDDGWLVRDLNGNGSIDNGTELFGDNTRLADGTRALDGFAALADLDSNADGVIDTNDAAFGELKVWQDANQDGISQAGELKTLSELGIASLSLTPTASGQVQNDSSQGALGNWNLAEAA